MTLGPFVILLAAFGVLEGLVLTFVAYSLSHRKVSPAAQFAANEFLAYWCGLAVSAWMGAGMILLANSGALSLTNAETEYLLSILVGTFALAGLVGYLIYVYTGRYHLVEVGILYGLFYVAALDWILSRRADGILIQGGVPSLNYVYSSTAAGWLFAFVVVTLLVPPLISALLYLSLLRRTKNPMLRYRILLVGASILLWFDVSLFAPTPTSAAVSVLSFIDPTAQLLAGMLGFFAFFPPAFVLRRWGGGPTEERETRVEGDPGHTRSLPATDAPAEGAA